MIKCRRISCAGHLICTGRDNTLVVKLQRSLCEDSGTDGIIILKQKKRLGGCGSNSTGTGYGLW